MHLLRAATGRWRRRWPGRSGRRGWARARCPPPSRRRRPAGRSAWRTRRRGAPSRSAAPARRAAGRSSVPAGSARARAATLARPPRRCCMLAPRSCPTTTLGRRVRARVLLRTVPYPAAALLRGLPRSGQHQLRGAGDAPRSAAHRQPVRLRRRHLLLRLLPVRDPRNAAGRDLERAQADRAHPRRLGAGRLRDGLRPHAAPVLTGCGSCWAPPRPASSRAWSSICRTGSASRIARAPSPSSCWRCRSRTWSARPSPGSCSASTGVAWPAGAGCFCSRGCPAIVLGVVTFFYLTDRPRQARWLDGCREGVSARTALARESAATAPGATAADALGRPGARGPAA